MTNVLYLHYYDYITLQVYDYGNTETEPRTTCLNVQIMSDPQHGRVFYGTFFAFAFVIPMTLICVLYASMIFRLLRGHGVGGGRHRTVCGFGSSESARARRRVTRLVVAVVAAFAVCWLPIHVVFIVQYFEAASDESMITHTFVAIRLAATCLAYANSCLNPILYAFLSENFRSGLVRLCCRGHRNTVAEPRGRREVTCMGERDRSKTGARPLLVIEEDEAHAAKDSAKVEGCISMALQIPTYSGPSTTRHTETSAVVETAL